MDGGSSGAQGPICDSWGWRLLVSSPGTGAKGSHPPGCGGGEDPGLKVPSPRTGGSGSHPSGLRSESWGPSQKPTAPLPGQPSHRSSATFPIHGSQPRPAPTRLPRPQAPLSPGTSWPLPAQPPSCRWGCWGRAPRALLEQGTNACWCVLCWQGPPLLAGLEPGAEPGTWQLVPPSPLGAPWSDGLPAPTPELPAPQRGAFGGCGVRGDQLQGLTFVQGISLLHWLQPGPQLHPGQGQQHLVGLHAALAAGPSTESSLRAGGAPSPL